MRRYAPLAKSAGTTIPLTTRMAVLERDRGCLGPRIGMPGDCLGSVQLDHIAGSGALGKKSPSTPENLASLCGKHHLEKTVNGRKWRPALLEWINNAERSLSETTEETGVADHPDAPARRAPSRW